MMIHNKDYPVIGFVEASWGDDIPVVDIPLMSDEEWQASARKNAVENYVRKFGREPETIEKAVEWQRRYCQELCK